MGAVLQSIQIVLGVVQIAAHDLPDGAVRQHLLKHLRQLLRQVIAAIFGKSHAQPRRHQRLVQNAIFYAVILHELPDGAFVGGQGIRIALDQGGVDQVPVLQRIQPAQPGQSVLLCVQKQLLRLCGGLHRHYLASQILQGIDIAVGAHCHHLTAV